MKLIKMLYGLTLMLGCFVLASCVNDGEELCLPDSSGQTKVLFTLVLPNNAQTRADWSTNTNAADSEGLDNYIDLNTIKMFIFDANNEYKGTLSDVIYIAKELTSDTYEPTAYEFIGTVPETVNVPDVDYKLVVVANTTDIPTTITWDGLKKIVFEKSGASVDKIPMWGFLKAKLTLKKCERQDLDDLPLLRAMAKVSVKLTQGMVNNGFSLKSITLNKYNTKGFVGPTEVLPSNAPDDAELNSTSAIDQEDCIHVYTADGYEPSSGLEFSVANNSIKDNSVEFYLPEYNNSNKDATMTVVVSYKDPDTQTVEEFTYYKGIEFKNYNATTGEGTDEYFNIVRNHHYMFNIINAAIDGPLYVVPTVLPWNDVDKIEDYKIAVSSNMRLFDSWLYRYDTVGKDYFAPQNPEDENSKLMWENWATSHMAVAPGLVTNEGTEKNKPLYSPQIQLVTTLPANTTEMTYSLELRLDNEAFQFVQVNKNADLEITGYSIHEEKLTIANGTDVYTYFYIVPKNTTTPTNRVAKVTLVYDDPVVGEITVPFNYNALPGYSDDSSEIWAYYFPVDEYNITDKLKMYYQDASNPLVPTPVQN